MGINNNTSMETVSGIFFDVANPSPEDVKLTDIAWSLSRQPRFAGHTITKLPYNVAHHSVFVAEIVGQLVDWFDDYSGTYEGIDTDKEAINNPPPFLSVQDSFNWAKLASLKDSWQDFSISLADGVTNSVNEGNTVHPIFMDPRRAIIMLALLHDAHEYVLVDIPSPIKQIDSIRAVYKALEEKIDSVIIEALFKLSLWPDVKQHAHAIIKAADMISRKLEAYMYMPSRGSEWAGLPEVDILAIHNFNEPMTAVESYQSFMRFFEKV